MVNINQITSELSKNKNLLKRTSYNNHTTNKNLVEVTDENKAKFFPNAVKNEVELITALGRKWKSNIALVGSFVDLYQYVTRNDIYNELPISTHSKRLLQIYKNEMTISRLIKTCEDIGLLYCVKTDFSFNHTNKTACRCYYYNKDVQNIIKEVVNKYNINTKRVVCNIDNNTYISLSNTFDSFKVKFSSKLRIGGVKNDKEVLTVLNEKYPQLHYYQSLADRMNENLPEDQQITYRPTLNKSNAGYVTKIGIRATSSLCSLKVHENENKDYDGIWRNDYLDNYFGKDEWKEFDVKSSIYRVAYLLKTGIWLDNDIDLYELMNGEKFANAEERNNFKEFAMRLYFDSSNLVFNHIKNALPYTIDENGENEVKESIKAAKQRMTNIIGEGIDNEIFFHESNIYLDFVSKLRAMDINVIQIYDGFFSNEDLSKYEDLLKNIAEDYYNRYINNNNIDNISYISLSNTFVEDNEINNLSDLAMSLQLNNKGENNERTTHIRNNKEMERLRMERENELC